MQTGQIGVVVGQLRDGLGIAGLGQVIAVAVEVETAERHLRDGLLDASAGRLFGCKHIVGYCIGGVAPREIEIAYGIIDLVEILLVAVIAGHALEGLDLRAYVGPLKHLALLDAGVELGAV